MFLLEHRVENELDFGLESIPFYWDRHPNAGSTCWSWYGGRAARQQVADEWKMPSGRNWGGGTENFRLQQVQQSVQFIGSNYKNINPAEYDHCYSRLWFSLSQSPLYLKSALAVWGGSYSCRGLHSMPVASPSWPPWEKKRFSLPFLYQGRTKNVFSPLSCHKIACENPQSWELFPCLVRHGTLFGEGVIYTRN